MTRQITQITTTAHGATKRTYDKVLKRFSDDGILSAIYALSSSVAKQRFVDPARQVGVRSSCPILWHVRSGSFVSFRICRRYVRSTPNSRHFPTRSTRQSFAVTRPHLSGTPLSAPPTAER